MSVTHIEGYLLAEWFDDVVPYGPITDVAAHAWSLLFDEVEAMAVRLVYGADAELE